MVDGVQEPELGWLVWVLVGELHLGLGLGTSGLAGRWGTDSTTGRSHAHLEVATVESAVGIDDHKSQLPAHQLVRLSVPGSQSVRGPWSVVRRPVSPLISDMDAGRGGNPH